LPRSQRWSEAIWRAFDCCRWKNEVNYWQRLVATRQSSKLADSKWAFRRRNPRLGPHRPGSFLRRPLNVSEEAELPIGAVELAQLLAAELDAAQCEYAVGGAIALGIWAEPRGTLDVDVTLFLPHDQPTACVRLLQKIGCAVSSTEAVQSLNEHGFCQVEFRGRRVDVFLPTIPFYERARQRRKTIMLGGQPVNIWDAETLCVFKVMFFRRKDLADVEQILRLQGEQLDRAWVTQELVQLYGRRDPRISQWEELLREIP
jgi:hypothetical protein